MNKKQIVVIVVVGAITGYLYLLPPKGLVKPKASRTNSGVASEKPSENINVASVSSTAKSAIGAALTGRINDLENQLKGAAEKDKTGLQKQLAVQWDDDNQPAPAAFYYLAVARKENKYDEWLNAGNRFNDAYKLTQDTAAQAAFTANSVEAFQNALKLKPESLDAKTGLGVAYVNGGAASPMQGILLLREVVQKDPNNRSANMNLGLFSMKSGQYEKAIDRFKTVIAQKPEFEPYFYLAETYKQLGKKTEAIAAYQKCKEMMPDPVFGQRIDEYIKELKN